MVTLIKNAKVYQPEYAGVQDILVLGDRIAAVGENLRADFGGSVEVEELDASGMAVVPGFIDSHEHILGGGGDLNGPTVGGILTIMGFSAFGKHARNIIPVMAGVFLGGVVMHWSLSDSAVQLACLFCTTLAPISGYFGWPFGVLAGFLHSSVVLYTGTPVAGMNLYNNGFSGGLVAIVLYPLIIDIFRHRRPTLTDRDYFDPVEHDEPLPPPDRQEMTEERDH